MESFDSAELYKQALAKKESDELDRLHTDRSEWHRFTARAHMRSQCIASDDPRLKEK